MSHRLYKISLRIAITYTLILMTSRSAAAANLSSSVQNSDSSGKNSFVDNINSSDQTVDPSNLILEELLTSSNGFPYNSTLIGPNFNNLFASGGLIDFLIPTLASAINNSGQATGYGTISNPSRIQAVPEPSNVLGTFTLGTFFAGYMLKRKLMHSRRRTPRL